MRAIAVAILLASLPAHTAELPHAYGIDAELRALYVRHVFAKNPPQTACEYIAEMLEAVCETDGQNYVTLRTPSMYQVISLSDPPST